MPFDDIKEKLLTPPSIAETYDVAAKQDRVTYIGGVAICGHAVLAPMAGICDYYFRSIARRYGASAVYTEFVSSDGLVRAHDRTRRLLHFEDDQRPIGAQVFGSDPGVVADAAAIVEEQGFDIVDINFGCPVKKVTKRNAGSALLKNPKLLGQIVRAAADAVQEAPLTAKIRAGWNEINAVEIANICEDNGAAAVAVHGRTQKMGFSGDAMWDVIRDVKQAVGIPVIGNGDVFAPGDAFEMIEQTGCDIVMVGRAAQGNPWLFMNINRMAMGLPVYTPSPHERLAQGLAHQVELLKERGEQIGIREMRKHWSHYSKGLRGASLLRKEIFRLSTHEEVVEALVDWAKRSGTEITVSV